MLGSLTLLPVTENSALGGIPSGRHIDILWRLFVILTLTLTKTEQLGASEQA